MPGYLRSRDCRRLATRIALARPRSTRNINQGNRSRKKYAGLSDLVGNFPSGDAKTIVSNETNEKDAAMTCPMAEGAAPPAMS